MDLIRTLWTILSGYFVLLITVGVGLIVFFGGMVLLFDHSKWWIGLLMMAGGVSFAVLGAKLGLKMGAGR